MNDNQELRDHLSDQPLDYVKEPGKGFKLEDGTESGNFEPATWKQKAQFQFPWPVLMLFVGIWIGFFLGVTR